MAGIADVAASGRRVEVDGESRSDGRGLRLRGTRTRVRDAAAALGYVPTRAR